MSNDWVIAASEGVYVSVINDINRNESFHIPHNLGIEDLYLQSKDKKVLNGSIKAKNFLHHYLHDDFDDKIGI